MSTKESQLKIIAFELSEIKKDLVRGDIKECAEETGIGYNSISKYISGQVLHPDTGIIILNWFRNLLKERESKVKAS